VRSAFVQTIDKLAAQDSKVLLLTGDLGFKIFDDFRRDHPQQFLNMGIAEANMVSVSAGLALEGKTPFVYSIAAFLTMRAYEHVRNDICFHKAKVILVAAGGGFCYGANGASHHALTDIAIMRALPEMRIFTPADAYEGAWAVRMAYSEDGPSYIRLGRDQEPVVHAGELAGPDVRRGVVLREGKEIAILVSGFILSEACQAADALIKEGHSVRLITFPLIKPLNEGLIAAAFEQCKRVFTVEEHSSVGGFFSAVVELAADRGLDLNKLSCVSSQDVSIHETGTHEYLRCKAGLDHKSILRRIKERLYADRA